MFCYFIFGSWFCCCCCSLDMIGESQPEHRMCNVYACEREAASAVIMFVNECLSSQNERKQRPDYRLYFTVFYDYLHLRHRLLVIVEKNVKFMMKMSRYLFFLWHRYSVIIYSDVSSMLYYFCVNHPTYIFEGLHTV